MSKSLAEVRQRFEQRADIAHIASVREPTALTKLEEAILHLDSAQERAEAQSVLLRSQDAFRMTLPTAARSFLWVGCIVVEAQGAPLAPRQAMELAMRLNEATSDLGAPLQMASRDQNERTAGVVVADLRRLNALDRMWMGFHACSGLRDGVLEFCAECTQRDELPRLVIAAAIPEPTMTAKQLQDPERRIAETAHGTALLDRIAGVLEEWNRRHTQRLAPVEFAWQRLSAIVEQRELSGGYDELRPLLLSHAPAHDGSRQQDELDSSTFPDGVCVVAGALPTVLPAPGQAAQAVWCDPHSGALLRWGLTSLLAGTDHEVVLQAAVRVAEEHGVRVVSALQLPRAPVVRKLETAAVRLPCPDGQYRSIEMAYLGRVAWRFQRFDWSAGWGLGGGPFESEEAVRVLQGLPHPIAIEAAGGRAAMAAHFGPELLAELQEQLRRPGVFQFAATGQLRLRDPALHDLVPGESPGPLQEDPLDVPTGLYAAMHWKEAGGVLMVARNTLLMRMEETSIEKGFPIRYLRVPYPDVFIHFEQPLERRRRDGSVMRLTGFYASEVAATEVEFQDPQIERIVTLIFAYTYDREVLRVGGLELHFAIGKDDERDLRDIIRERASQLGAGFDDAQDDDRQDALFADGSALLAAKVLLYTTLRSARFENRAERTALISELQGLKGSKRDKLAARIKRAYDFILVGPEEDEDDQEVAEMGRRQVRPHWRTGFFRNQAWGEKFALRKQVWIPPVLVNAAKAGRDTPDKKTYVLE